MLSVKQAIDQLLERATCLAAVEEIELKRADGRVLAESIVSGLDVPPADNSAMDGYAFRHADWVDSRSPLEISARVTAGMAPGTLQPGTAARIFTGAEVPAGADTVVMQEHCEGSPDSVEILKRPSIGANIRPRGQDIHEGQQVLPSGHRLRPQDVGLLASLGMPKVSVYQALRVAVCSTGDELKEPGEPLQAGQIYNSNRYLMKTQLERWGFEVLDMGVAPDRASAVTGLLQRAAEQADVVITSGGVSVGEEDHVKNVVESLGGLDLWKMAIKPGKPFAFGRIGTTPFIGLPGNPVSVFVTLLVVARPYLFACQGNGSPVPVPVPAVACFSRDAGSREEYIRVRLTPSGLVDYDNQSSGVLFSTTWGDGFLRQRQGEEIVEGETADYLPFSAYD